MKDARGIALAQDPEEAVYPAMPRNAMARVELHAVLPIQGLAEWIVQLCGGHATVGGTHHVEVTGGPRAAGSGFTCPDCGAVLRESVQDGAVRLRCVNGHVHSPESLTQEQGRELERALSIAVRTLEERSVLLSGVAERAGGTHLPDAAATFTRQAQDARAQAAIIRDSILCFDESEQFRSADAGLA